jgi:hypothetical protein
VPRRRRTALPLLVAAGALATGCEIAVSPDAVPVPFSVAPVPSASANRPEYVCTAAYKILTDGAVRLAGFVAGPGDGIRETLTGMAAQIDAEAARTGDPGLRQALRTISADLTAGARQSDPEAYLNEGFPTVGQALDGSCD